MSVAQCEAINAQLRAAGLTVHEYPNWRTRGVSMSTAFEGGIVHHTATPYGTCPQVLVTGRGQPNPLPGPLANYSGNADGSLTVIAAGVANHAGASGGRSMGPLPVTSSFNRRVLGLEIVYPGSQPMTAAQYLTATVWARVVADVVGYGDIQRVRAHAETSVTGKWDPGFAPGQTINMDQFRHDAEHGTLPPRMVDDMYEPTDRVVDLDMAHRVKAFTQLQDATPGDAPIPNDPVPAATYLRVMAWRMARLMNLDPTTSAPGAHAVEDMPVVTLLKQVAADLAEVKARPAGVGGSIDYVQLAKAMCDEQDRRARDGDSATGPVS